MKKPREQGHFRSSPRPQIASKVTIRKTSAGDDQNVVAYTRDIGMGGVFVETSEAFAMGDIIDVALSTPSMWEPLALKASVCRVENSKDGEPGGVGLSFTDLTDIQSMALGELTASLDYEE